jgi:hypothetical protein
MHKGDNSGGILFMPNITEIDLVSPVFVCVGHIARMGEKSYAYRIMVGKPEGKRPLGRSGHRWVDNIKMDLREIEWDGVDWIDVAQDRDRWRALVNTALNLRVS